MISFQENISLVPYTTFGIDAKARFFVEIERLEDLVSLQNDPRWEQLPHLFLGTGANILFTKDYEGIVVKVNILGKEIISQESSSAVIRVGAGENWNDFIFWTIAQGYGGLENLAGIPSSVGAAAYGNIGAYGMEAKDRIVCVHGIHTSTGKKKSLSLSDCNFSYRTSIFKTPSYADFLITTVDFSLPQLDDSYLLNMNYKDIQLALTGKPLPSVQEFAQLIVDIRNTKLPDWHILGTAGSFFKNPIIQKLDFDSLLVRFPGLVSFPGSTPDHVKLSAGQLIELAGLKGYRSGNVGVYEKHALILVNCGGAKGQEIVDLAVYIQNKVESIFGVFLEPEVIYV